MKKLDIFISRQEKVVSIYKYKGKTEQFRMVSDSLELLIELRSIFKNWFNEMECTVWPMKVSILNGSRSHGSWITCFGFV